jgi:integrase
LRKGGGARAEGWRLEETSGCHDLRHTYATLALEAGIHPKVVSERLGHSSFSITLDTYSHAIPGMEDGCRARGVLVLSS